MEYKSAKERCDQFLYYCALNVELSLQICTHVVTLEEKLLDSGEEW